MNILSDAYQVYLSAIILGMFAYMIVGLLRVLFKFD